MIEKQTSVDQITVTENGIILYREATRIIEDGKELTKTYHRSSLTPGQDLTGVPANVVAICNTVWTAEVIAAYQAQQEANNPTPVESPAEGEN
jgi:DNA-binding transcriptional LysR family regulator